MTIVKMTRAAAGATERTTLPEFTQVIVTGDNCYHSKSDSAAAEGAAVASDLKSGMLKTIDACVRTLEARRAYENNIEAFDAFLRPLQDTKLLSPSEVRLRGASPKLSKLCKVGEYADRLKHEQLMAYFLDGAMSGFMLAYQATVLLDQMPAGEPEETRIGRLVDTLRRDGITTLEGMRGLTKRLKAVKSSQRAIVEPVEQADDISHAVRRDYDCVVAAPSRHHLRKLDEWYADKADLPRCLRTGLLVEDNAAFVIVAPLSALSVRRSRPQTPST